jgi:hypothetical protein
MDELDCRLLGNCILAVDIPHLAGLAVEFGDGKALYRNSAHWQ